MTAPAVTWRRRVGRWLVVLLGAYCGVLLLLLWLENSLVYHPSGPSDWNPPPTPEFEDVYLTLAEGIRVHAWWLPRQNSSAAVLYFHGNAGNLSWRGNSMLALRHHLNASVLIVDYPGYGKSEGKPSEAGCYQCADAAYAWLTDAKKVPHGELLLYGASLGGGVAVDLASRKPHRALVLVKTFTTLPDVGQAKYPILPVHWLMRNRFDSLSKITACKSPIFVAHGDADRLIPYEQGQRLFEAANEPKEFLRLTGHGHNDPVEGDFFGHLLPFLAKHAPIKN